MEFHTTECESSNLDTGIKSYFINFLYNFGISSPVISKKTNKY